MYFNPLRDPLDIVHVHLAAPTAALAGFLYAKLKKPPFVVSYHGDLVLNLGNFVRKFTTTFYNNLLHNRILSYADAIISPSKSYIKNSRFLWRYENKVVVISHGIVHTDFHVPYDKLECRKRIGLPLDANIILFVGWLSPHKGPDILIRAMTKILYRVPDAVAVFMGTGESRGDLERLAKKLDIINHIRFMGYIKEKIKKALIYNSSDIFAFPSTMTESFGLSCLEAMECGLPIVASNIGGIPDQVVNGLNGLLVPPRDPEALAEAIICLFKNKEMKKRMSNEGKLRAQRYSWPRIAEKIEKLYFNLLESNLLVS